MARPRKPTAALELAGAFKHDPSRKQARANEPRVTDPVGDPPGSLVDDAVPIWEELASVGHWLTRADRLMLELVCDKMAHFRRGGGEWEAKDFSALINALNKLGFGPAERSKIQAPGAKEEDKPSGFAQFKR